MGTELYYLSGTGNTLYAAKELEKRIPDTKLISVMSLNMENSIKTSAEAVGFIFPVHFMTAPNVVLETIKKLDLSKAEYVFVIATRYGTPCGQMMKKIDRILKNKGKRLNSQLILTMANNDPKFKNRHQYTQEEMEKFDTDLKKKLDRFQMAVLNKEDYQEQDTQITFPVNPVMERIGLWMIDRMGDGTDGFYADTKCNGCGICMKICLTGRIKMSDGKPDWDKNINCCSCYACINYCPVQSVQIKSSKIMKFYTKENGRYQHPDISMEEIIAQKL